MNMRIPAPLTYGANVALLAPSGPVPPDRLDAAVASVEAFGLLPVVYPSCKMRHGYFAGDDMQRATDINTAFNDRHISGIICMRGGYGAHRLMPYLDLKNIAANPKFFCGYSDITALHLLFNQRCKFVTYHTPMPSTEWYQGLDNFTTSSLKGVLFGLMKREMQNPPEMPLSSMYDGVCEGELIGGNLSLMTATLGTPYELDAKGKVLFIEDVDEEPYRIDRMLLMLKHSGKFRDCAGILLGAFTNCKAKEPEQSLNLQNVLDELLLDEEKPILQGLQCGHVLPTLSLPLGLRVRMDTKEKTITFVEEES